MNELNQDSATHGSSRRLTKLIGLFGVVLLTFCAGYLYGVWEKTRVTPQEAIQQIVRQSSQEQVSEKVDFSLYWDVWNRVKRDYVRQPVDDANLFYGSISGLVKGTGDPYSVFFDPTQTQAFQQALSGSFGGVGMELGSRNGQVVVIAPLADTPAEQAGVKAGDVIVAVDGVYVDDKTVEEVVSQVRGEEGTQVKILLQRDGGEPFEVNLTRQIIKPASVKVEYQEQAGKTAAVITISQFTKDSATEFTAILNELLLKSPDLVVLDLRNNPGGFVDSAVSIASEWIADGPILYEKNQVGEKTPTNSTGAGRLSSQKTIVLIDGGSASASEIVAGALQDDGKATLIGATSFGKGSVQDVHYFPDGSTFKLTISLWLTPKGRTIDQVGITPDVEVPYTAEDFVAGKDPQLQAALDSMNQ